MRFQRFANIILRFLMRILLRIHISGLEHVPRSGRLIVMMNHLYFLDPLLVSAWLPRDIAIMSKIENLRLPILGWIVKWYGSYPVRRGEADLQAMKQSLAILEREMALLMAPEGTRSKTGRLQPGHRGLALLALRAKAPILPIAISGQEKFGQNLRRLRRTPVAIAFGEPFLFASDSGRARRAQMTQMTREAMYRLAALLPEAYRGAYADLSQATTGCIRPYPPSEDG